MGSDCGADVRADALPSSDNAQTNAIAAQSNRFKNVASLAVGEIFACGTKYSRTSGDFQLASTGKAIEN